MNTNQNSIVSPIHVGFAGRYKLQAVRVNEDGSETRRDLTDWFDNLITDNGIDQIGRNWNQSPLSTCYVGSGSTPPTVSDTGMAALVASTSSGAPGGSGEGSAIIAGPPRYGYRRIVWRFAQGAAAGNLAEVGIGSAAYGLFSRALIVDGNGDPTTITVTAMDFLDVLYELRCYIPTGDVVTNETISGVSYTVTRRPAQNNNSGYWAQAIPAVNGQFGPWGMVGVGTGALGNETTNPSYPEAAQNNSFGAHVPGVHERTVTASFPIGAGNMNITRAGFDTGIGAWQFGFSPAIPKDNTKTLNLTFKITWGRYP